MPIDPLIAARFPLIADITGHDRAVTDPDAAERLALSLTVWGLSEARCGD